MTTPLGPLTLNTFAMSHYSEKIRWSLDACQLPFTEHCLTPVFHIPTALRLGRRGQTTLPILETSQGAIQDSPRIISWLAKTCAPCPVLPPAFATEIRAVEKRFDAIGKDVARALYAGGFGRADAHITQLWTAYASSGQAAFIRLAYPVIRWAFKRKLHITEANAQRAQKRITEAIDWLEAQLADGRPYLVGGRFTVADITAASLLAPLACPPQHPVYCEVAYQEGMATAIGPWRDRPALVWVRDTYARHRGVMGGGVLGPNKD
jgi:glutathione S-transferase